jgi:hypothetical protein
MSKEQGVNLYDSVDSELLIDLKNLHGELIDQPLLMRKWTKAKAIANKRTKQLRARLAHAKGNLHKQLAARGLRVGDIEAAINTDPNIINIQEELNEAEYEFEALEGIVRAFYQKHESLKDLSANIRKGMEG